MQGPAYIFGIQDKDFRFWKLDALGNVVCDAQPYFLVLSPAGWESIAVDNQRNRKYWGLDRTVITGLGFARDAAKILKHIWTKKGINEETYLVIAGQRLVYEPFPKGVLAYTAGQSPFTANAATTGTITGTPGDTVRVKMTLVSPDPPDDYVDGNFDAFNFLYTGFTNTLELMPEIIYDLVVPPGGVINFNLTFHQGPGSPSVAGMNLVNVNGTDAGYFFWYKQVSRTQIDWNTYNHTGSKVTCATLEDGFIKYLKSRESVVQEIPALPTDPNVKMDGIVFHNIVENFVNNGGNGDPNFDFGNHLVDLQITKEDAPYVPSKKSVSRLKVGNTNSIIRATQAWFVKATTASLIEVEWDFWINTTYYAPPGINPAGIYLVVIRKIDANGVGSNAHILIQLSASQVSIGGGHDYHLVGTANINVVPGDELYLYTLFTVQGATGDAQLRTTYLDTITPSKFNYKYKYREATTYIKAKRPADLFAEHVARISDGKYQADTSGLLTDEMDKVFSSGNMVRAIDGSVIKQSINDFIKFWDTFKDVGLQITPAGKVQLKRKVDMVDYNDIFDLGQVSNLTVTTATDFPFNRLKIGYPDKQQEGLNGKEAFCNQWEWLVDGLLLVEKELDKTCNTIADCYSADITRLDFGNRDTTDSRQDNDNYVLHIEDVEIPAAGLVPAHYKLDRVLNVGATGLLEPETIFNLGLSVKRCLLNNGGDLHSRLDLMEGRKILFKTASKNDKVVAGGITEKEDVLISTLLPQYYRPIFLEFDTAGTFQLLELLDANPSKLFKFSIDGSDYVVLPDKLSITPALGKKKRFKMLCGAGTDLTPLIDFYGGG